MFFSWLIPAVVEDRIAGSSTKMIVKHPFAFMLVNRDTCIFIGRYLSDDLVLKETDSGQAIQLSEKFAAAYQYHVNPALNPQFATNNAFGFAPWYNQPNPGQNQFVLHIPIEKTKWNFSIPNYSLKEQLILTD